MLHMKLNSAVSVFAVAAAFAVLLPSPAYSGICFLPDCADEDLAGGGGNMNINEDTEFCESKGFTYYASGECPQYYAKVGQCNRDDHYLKCDAKTWCEQNGYNTTSCSIPQYLSEQCPNGENLYKSCQTDNDRACKELGYTKACPSGQKLKKNSGRCSYDSSYGTCCTPTGCPSYTSLTSSSYGTNGTDGCEYTCYYTCNMNCPSSYPYSSDPTGCSSRTTNGCGNKSCYNYVSCCTPSCTSYTGTCNYYSYLANDGCGSTCIKCQQIKVGDIYYSDGTITSDILNKTPIGIVFKTNGKNGLIVSLEETGYINWTNSLEDTPTLNNFNETTATSDADGKNNTEKLINYYGSQAPAAYYCSNYNTPGTNKGEWYLGAYGEMYHLYKNRTTINNKLKNLNKKQISTNDFWTSTEGNKSCSEPNCYAIIIRLSDGYTAQHTKNDTFYTHQVVRAIKQF